MAVLSHRSAGAHTYQPTDLTGSERRAFINQAKDGLARLRDSDGASLVMLPEGELAVLSELRTHLIAYLSLENALRRPSSERRPTDFGHLAWADRFDEEDLEVFRGELGDALTRAATAKDLECVEEVLHAWRLTADLLTDTEAISRINQDLDSDEYEGLGRPEADE